MSAYSSETLQEDMCCLTSIGDQKQEQADLENSMLASQQLDAPSATLVKRPWDIILLAASTHLIAQNKSTRVLRVSDSTSSPT